MCLNRCVLERMRRCIRIPAPPRESENVRDQVAYLVELRHGTTTLKV